MTHKITFIIFIIGYTFVGCEFFQPTDTPFVSEFVKEHPLTVFIIGTQLLMITSMFYIIDHSHYEETPE